MSQRVFKMKNFAMHLCLAIGVLTLQGCSNYDPSAHRVEKSTARQTLEQVLKSWQDGDPPEAWQDKNPKVVVQDMDWKSGAKLKSFEILGEGEAVDANLHCQVKLSFERPQNGQREKTVIYLVGTSPVLTVFRSPVP